MNPGDSFFKKKDDERMCLDWKDNQDKQQQYKILSLSVCYFFFLIKFLSPPSLHTSIRDERDWH